MQDTTQRRPEGLMSALLHHSSNLEDGFYSMQSPTDSQTDAFITAAFAQPPSNQSSRAPSPSPQGPQMRPEDFDKLNNDLTRPLAYGSTDVLGDNGEVDHLMYPPHQILGHPSFPDSAVFSAPPNSNSMQFPNQGLVRGSATSVGDGMQEASTGTSPSLSFKHAKISHGDSPGTPKSQRYACPYNKWDPEGSPLCCMPSNKNPGGGAETFSRVKSHILRNHDESVRCRRCWSSFVGKPEAMKEHIKAHDCMYKTRPKGYWMNEYQTTYVRGQRFEGGSEEKWYHLFRILLPHVKICDDQGNYLISPYYTPLSERGNEQAIMAALQVDGKHPDFQPSSWPFSNQNSATGSPCVHYENMSLQSSTCASPIGIDDTLTANTSFSSVDYPINKGSGMAIGSNPGTMSSFISTGTPRAIPIRGSHRIDAAMDEPCSSAVNSFSSSNAAVSMTLSHSKRLSANFLSCDNDRLRRDNRQLRQERKDLQRRIDAVRANIDPLNQIIEAALYQNNIPLEVSTKLFAATETLNNLRQALG